jgi:hypothetical protein
VEAGNDGEIGVKSIFSDLDMMIRNKAITAVSRNPETAFLDEGYGVRVEREYSKVGRD